MSNMDMKNDPSGGENGENDGIVEFLKKTLDPNKYATKKTIAQGLLDVALLTANASQLKYILQVGPKHEFYTLMLTLIIISIILQVAAGCLSIIVYILMDHTKNYEHNQVAWILNHFNLAFVTSIMFCDIIKMNFGLDPDVIVVVQGTLCIFLGVRININDQEDHPKAEQANNYVVWVNFFLMGVNVVINVFDMRTDPIT